MKPKKELLFEKLLLYQRENQKAINNLEAYLNSNPDATKRDLEREGFSQLLKLTGFSPRILKEYCRVSQRTKTCQKPRQTYKERKTKSILNKKLETEIISLIADKLNKPPESIYPNSRFHDLEADELDLIEIQIDLEDKYKIEIPYGEGKNLQAIDELIIYVNDKLREKTPSKKTE